MSVGFSNTSNYVHMYIDTHIRKSYAFIFVCMRRNMCHTYIHSSGYLFRLTFKKKTTHRQQK